MASHRVDQKPPIGSRDVEADAHGRNNQVKSFPRNQDNQDTRRAKRRSTCGIDRPLTPAKVSADKQANRLSLCSSIHIAIEEEKKESHNVDLPPRKLSFNEAENAGSEPGVATSTTVKLRKKPVRQPRPMSMFNQSDFRKPPLTASKSYDSNLFASSFFTKSISNSHDDLSRSNDLKMSRQTSFPNLLSKGSSLQRGSDLRIGNPVKKFNDIFRKDKTPNSKGVVMRKKKDNQKDSSQKAQFRKSLPALFSSKSVSNFNILKNTFNRSPTSKEFPELLEERNNNTEIGRAHV